MTFEEELNQILTNTPGLTDGMRKNLQTEILRAFELSKSPLGKRQGVTFMTEGASKAADKQRNKEDLDGLPPKPTSI